jgi:CRISPR-associated protein (TIGR03986 family)
LWNEHTRDYSLLHHPDQRPISAMREQITMAEKLFGWVLEGVSDQDEQSQDELPNGYRGRVTITDARSEETLRDAQLTNGDNRDNTELSGYFPMPILGTPKLPCPEFYFRGGSNWIRQELMTGGDTSTRIQGWKFYVVDKSTLRNNEPKRWKTAHPERDLKQKSWVRPVKCGTQFTFQVRFNQLTLLEYQLLCYAIQPAAQYSHRVGYGKPLGLGVVQLQTDRAELMNYSKRYREDRDLLTNSATWTLDDQTVADRAQEFAKLIKDHHKLIVAAGLPQEIDVSYPITQQQQRIETELYRWFVANRHTDGSVQQRLQPLDDQGLDEKGLIKPLNK